MDRDSHCVRVRPDGRWFETVRDAAGVESWLHHNRVYRPDDALFLNGRLAGQGDAGALSPEAVADVERRLGSEARDHDDTPPSGAAHRRERTSSGWFRWFGYAFETERLAGDPEAT